MSMKPLPCSKSTEPTFKMMLLLWITPAFTKLVTLFIDWPEMQLPHFLIGRPKWKLFYPLSLLRGYVTPSDCTFETISGRNVLKFVFTVQMCNVEHKIVTDQFIVVDVGRVWGTFCFISAGVDFATSIQWKIA